jgi:hypothetical protein
MKKIFSIAFAGLLALTALTCADEEKGPAPDDIKFAGYEALPGEILLKWEQPDVPAYSNIHQIQISYHDPRLKKTVHKVASAYSTSAVIPKTRQKYGDYTFTIQTVSREGRKGTPQTVTAKSGKALSWTEFTYSGIADTVKLTTESFSVHISGGDSNFENLIDNDNATFFGTNYSGENAKVVHWLQIDLGEENVLKQTNQLALTYVLRDREGHFPTAITLLGSELGDALDEEDNPDGDRWFTICMLTKDDSGLPATKSQSFKSAYFPLAKDNVRYLRFKVTKTSASNDDMFWDLAEFGLLTLAGEKVVYDPETSGEDI